MIKNVLEKPVFHGQSINIRRPSMMVSLYSSIFQKGYSDFFREKKNEKSPGLQ
jgi:hypothetical protein